MNAARWSRLCCAVAALLPAALMAAPVTLTGSGVWTAVDPVNVVNINGLGTNAISWGTPLGANLSGYSFSGNTAVVDPLDGTVFTVGTFTHNNFVLSATPTPNSITGATLQVNFDITGEQNLSRAFTFQFLHNETTNADNPCPFPSPHPQPVGGCEDVVSLQTVFSQETLDFGGATVKLEILGFLQGEVLVDQFLTLENAANSALIQARFTSDFAAPVPEPSTAALLIAGLLALHLGARRRAYRRRS